MPGVVDKLGGVGKITVTRPSGEVLSLDLPWVLEWMKYTYLCEEEGNPQLIIDSMNMEKYPEIYEYFNSP